MKILLDENLDENLPEHMPDHEVFHVVKMGWQGTTNGQLLAKADEGKFQVFITADKNMPYQQSMAERTFPLLVLDIHPNILVNQAACVAKIEQCIKAAKPGQVYLIEGPHPKRHS